MFSPSIFFSSFLLNVEVSVSDLCHSHPAEANRGLSHIQCLLADVALFSTSYPLSQRLKLVEVGGGF